MDDKLKRLKESMDDSIFKENPVSHKNKEQIFERIEKSQRTNSLKNIFSKWLSRGAMAIVSIFFVFFLWSIANDQILNFPGNKQQDVPAVDQEENDSNVKQDDELNPKTLRFHGESVNWKVEYLALTKLIEQTTVGPIGNQTDYIELQYIGDGQPPTEIEYYINSPAGDSSAIDVILKDGKDEMKGGGCDNCIILTENDVMEMTIEWAGEREIIKLETQ